MNPVQLLDHFDRISDAADAIARLRRFILDLAVRGKLVEQDPREGSGSILLEEVRKLKEQLLRERHVQNEKNVEYSVFATHIHIPTTWVWAYVNDVALVQGGKRLPAGAGFAREQTPHIYIRITDMKDGTISAGDLRYITTEVQRPIAKYTINQNDLYITIAGTIGQIGKVPPMFDGQNLTENAAKIVFRGVNPDFLCMALRSDMIQQQFKRKTNQVAQPKLALKRILGTRFPLPPLAEQQRIMAKVDELMALCDRLEAAQAERESRRDKLAAASQHRLNNGADADELREHARFHLRHLPRLTTRPEHIQQLRQTILNLAVRGKLVPQDPDDEPTSAVGISSPKGSRGHGVEERPEDDAWPNEVPSSWKWHRLGSISEQITDGEHATPPRIDDEQVPLVTAKNVRDGFMDYGKTDWVSFQTANKAWVRCRPTVGDVLLVCVGATTGRLCVLREPRDMVLVRSVALIRPTSAINVDYLALALRSPMCQAQMWEKVKMTAQPCLYINRINSLPIPLPPLAEQYRIVAKVDELMALCDRLETQLNTTQTESRRFLEAVLHEALNNAD